MVSAYLVDKDLCRLLKTKRSYDDDIISDSQIRFSGGNFTRATRYQMPVKVVFSVAAPQWLQVAQIRWAKPLLSRSYVFFKVMWPFNDDVPSGFWISHKRKVFQGYLFLRFDDPFPFVLGLKVSLFKSSYTHRANIPHWRLYKIRKTDFIWNRNPRSVLN